MLTILTPNDIEQVPRRDTQQPTTQYVSLYIDGSKFSQLPEKMELIATCAAPIHKLPLEALSYIFELSALQTDEAPLWLSLVCRKWKDAAMSPRLWSRIVIDLVDIFAENKAAFYLKRSRDSPLDVEIYRFGFTEFGWGAWVKVLEHARRWRTLEISASTFDDVRDILGDLPVLAPKLVHTTITVEGPFFFHGGPAEVRRLALVREFLGYPNFRSLRLRTWALPMLRGSGLPVFAGLTTIHLTDTYASTFRKTDGVRFHSICGNAVSALLSLCPLLETFTFDARETIPREFHPCCRDPVGIFTLPALQHISLVANYRDTFGIMDHLILPVLRTAHIEPLPRYTATLAENFVTTWDALLTRSRSPPLEKLHFSAMAPDDVVRTLERMPALKQLHFAYCTNPAAILKALAAPYTYTDPDTPDTAPRWLCSRLRQFYFEDCFHVPWRTVARLVQKRHRAYLDGRQVGLIVDLIINGHDVLEDRDLDAMVHFKLRHAAILIEP